MEEKYWRAFTDMSRLVRPVHRETEWLPVQHRALAIDAPGAIDDWPDVEYQYDDNGPPVSLDSVRTHRGIVLWSERMRELVENLLLPEEEVQWLPVTVTAEDVSLPAYFAPNPLYGPEALHGQTTRMPGDGPLAGGVVKGVFARDRINSRAMLKYPYGSEPVVAERVRRAVEEAGFTGFDFAPVPVRQVPLSAAELEPHSDTVLGMLPTMRASGLGFLAVLAACQGCNSVFPDVVESNAAAPRAVVESYLGAQRAGDVEEAYGHLCKNSRESRREFQKRVDRTARDDGLIETYRIKVSDELSNGHAVVKYDLITDQKTVERTVTLDTQGDDWCISDID